MTVTQISILAGEILLFLDRRGGAARFEDILPPYHCSHDQMMMALGWLYKEGLIRMQPAMGGWAIRTA